MLRRMKAMVLGGVSQLETRAGVILHLSGGLSGRYSAVLLQAAGFTPFRSSMPSLISCPVGFL